MASSANVRDKLELLQVKETELIRLRREADSQLLNELSSREDRLAELRSDFEHNLKVRLLNLMLLYCDWCVRL